MPKRCPHPWRGDWENYTILVHSIKSTSRLIEEPQLADLAEGLEHAGNTEDLDFIRADHARFLNWYQSLLVKYRGLRISGTNANEGQKPDISSERVREAFLGIRELALAYDDGGIQTILDTLKEHTLPADLRQAYRSVSLAFDKLDWDALQNLAF